MRTTSTVVACTRYLDRRGFLGLSAGAAVVGTLGWPRADRPQPGDGWNQGQLTHLIPTASHERFLIKASFKGPLTGIPRLSVNGKPVPGETKRSPVIVQGDCHASAAGKMLRSGELALAQPVDVVMTGTLGTGDMPFPSSYRSIESTPSQLVGMDQALKPTEKNGFCVIDVEPDKLTFTQFTWRPPQPVDEIDTMQPALVYEVPRKA